MAILEVVLFAAALVPPLVFPDFLPPTPSGPHGVGITDLHLIDTARAENMTADPDDRRELMVRVWYPARVPVDAAPEPFLREVEPLYGVLARGAPFLEPHMLGHLQRVRSHSYLDAPLADGLADAQERFPVLIFSHGNSLYASQNSLLMEHLASHGYVVFGIDHPYQASAVRFPDGRVAKYQQHWQTKEPLDAEEIGRQQRLFYQALRAPSYDRYLLLIDQLIAASPGANEGVQLWVEDTAFLLDELARGPLDGAGSIDRFTDRLDLDRVGVFGMSLGGAVAGRFCEQDTRCKAGLNMDGLQYGATGTRIRIERPFMFIYADQRRADQGRADQGRADQGRADQHGTDQHEADQNEADQRSADQRSADQRGADRGRADQRRADQGRADQRRAASGFLPGVDAGTAVAFRMNDFAYRRAGDLAYFMTIAGASHLNFSDFAFVSSHLRSAGVLGEIEPETMRELLNDAVLAFFDRTLRGARKPLLEEMLRRRAGVLEFGQRDGRAHPVE